jgi:hypothetical protein
MYTFAIGRDDLPDDLVYQLVKAVFENQPRLLKTTSAARETIPQNAVKDTFLPFHPGAVRYYREIGIKIPDELTPMNWSGSSQEDALLHLLTTAVGTTRKRLAARIDSANWGEADSNAAAR